MTHAPKKKIAVLISGNGSNLQALIEASQPPQANFKIAIVLSNRPEAYGIVRAQQAQIPTVVIDHTQFEQRTDFDHAMQQALDDAQVDLIVLAGFMRILTPEFTEHYLGRMLNIHPSLLPKYPGLNTHQRAIKAGDSHHGVSIHFVTPELDGGPVIFQQSLPIAKSDTPETLAQKVHQIEHQAYPQVVSLVAQSTLHYADHQAYLKDQPLKQPLNLNEVIALNS